MAPASQRSVMASIISGSISPPRLRCFWRSRWMRGRIRSSVASNASHERRDRARKSLSPRPRSFHVRGPQLRSDAHTRSPTYMFGSDDAECYVRSPVRVGGLQKQSTASAAMLMRRHIVRSTGVAESGGPPPTVCHCSDDPGISSQRCGPFSQLHLATAARALEVALSPLDLR